MPRKAPGALELLTSSELRYALVSLPVCYFGCALGRSPTATTANNHLAGIRSNLNRLQPVQPPRQRLNYGPPSQRTRLPRPRRYTPLVQLYSFVLHGNTIDDSLLGYAATCVGFWYSAVSANIYYFLCEQTETLIAALVTEAAALDRRARA